MNAFDKYYDVIVIGAGPAGSSAAAVLARGGARVLLCDKENFPREKICGDCINPGCWRIFDELGVSEEIAAHAESIHGISIVGRSGKLINFSYDEERRNRTLNQLSKPKFVAIKRSALDQILLNQAIVDGASFSPATSIESVHQEKGPDNMWRIGLRTSDPDGLINIGCKVLIGADGRNSKVASLIRESKKSTIKRVEHSGKRIGIQFSVRRPSQLGPNVMMFFFENGYGGIVGVSPEAANIAMVIKRQEGLKAVEGRSEFIRRTIHSNGFMRETFSELRLIDKIRTAFPVDPRINHVSAPNIYLVGDACHTTEPFTGEGVFFAIADGVSRAAAIAKSFGLESKASIRLNPNPRLRDLTFSPLLRNIALAETLLRFGSNHRTIANLVVKSVLG
ncbi:MAG TPA: FAD-dependent monooxygenase [Bacteroidota bacterium]|nr:FAD-dependent monooxygenase [Bacteroidota bacterium]